MLMNPRLRDPDFFSRTSHLDRTSLVNKGFIIIYGQKDNIFSGKKERNPPPAWLANQNAGFV